MFFFINPLLEQDYAFQAYRPQCTSSSVGHVFPCEPISPVHEKLNLIPFSFLVLFHIKDMKKHSMQNIEPINYDRFCQNIAGYSCTRSVPASLQRRAPSQPDRCFSVLAVRVGARERSLFFVFFHAAVLHSGSFPTIPPTSGWCRPSQARAGVVPPEVSVGVHSLVEARGLPLMILFFP